MSEIPYDPLLFGVGRTEGIVAIDLIDGCRSECRVLLTCAKGGRREQKQLEFAPWLLVSDRFSHDIPGAVNITELAGDGLLNRRVSFGCWDDCMQARKSLAKTTNTSASSATAPYYCISDPVQQFLMASGETLYGGMSFGDVRRLQVDIECITTPGYDFCNAEREGDAIVAIALSDSTGWEALLSGVECSEKELLERFVETVVERDPDVIEGHNLFNFDLPYIRKRAERHGVTLCLGRNGEEPAVRNSRISIAERAMSYQRFDIPGRHVVDTMFLAQAYDVSQRSLESYGLKQVAVHFGVASDERTYIEGSEISACYQDDPERLMKYVMDDVRETRGIADILSRSSFVQTQMLPFGYQDVCVRGNATKIDALLVRAYLAAGESVPLADMERAFEGGYTDMFEEGVVADVHHCDVRSLYPSLMLNLSLGPKTDRINVFPHTLEKLREFRVKAKAAMRAADDEAGRQYWDALQSAFKILINSYYGYLGFKQGHFSDFGAASRVAEEGRGLLKRMIALLKERGARPIEIDTDGIYFVPPSSAMASADAMQAFRQSFAEALPDGIDIEFDGEFVSMFSYKMKNYALLDAQGNMIIKGAALKSRGLEPFQRKFLERLIRLKLEQRPEGIRALRLEFEQGITGREWPIREFGKSETLQESPAVYKAKRDRGNGSRRAAYELALGAERPYRAGDQVTYYVTGHKKRVAVVDHARLISDWDPENRDENVTYYLAKIESLAERFGETNDPKQGELF